METTEGQKRARDKWLAQFDQVKFCVPKGKKAELQAYATKNGESLNGLINRLIDEAMEQNLEGDHGNQ